MDKPTVLILLATYNGASYICQMVDSVLNQDYPNIHIILSDDLSSDGTNQILSQYALKYPDKITHYQSGIRFGSAQKHFMHLLSQFHNAPYIMFCDQDDIWHADKVSKTLDCMKMLEDNPEIPTLVHTDLRVVDREANLIATSFCNHSGLDGTRLSLNQLLVQNVVTGCTMMINRALAELACSAPYGNSMLMHDWWLALLASACGKCGFLNEPTIDYRQHGSNAVGAKNIHSAVYLMNRLCSNSMRRSLQNAADQASAFLDAYVNVLTEAQIRLIHAFIATREQSLIKRDICYLKYGLLKFGALRIAAQLLGL